ncbi:putative phage capsid protein,Predicted phage phi-C31 gp36 major capsid-like protein,phage major capsid protein, HK97 family,Phage capsid family [[Clostridium] sordellii]|uniref:phage major capsid protein n=1 Tax=Paraclostridium sordellii TaxID=1505 RepID=UPI000543BAB1|nr:phage major capsid protein [Paeniclostridium sordellii]CEK34344.1 putative phage capsid protein,Predicted phage phi-C31 gp36 major capsid-like protein,phage major capsid protein, HK97 family,Phage capsid family [[Clostridium] sordellii] [Paeniclostridium sordellii]
MNRFQLQQMFDGVKAQLKQENEKLSNMYMDSNSTIESRSEQQKVVKDLEERFNGIKKQIEELDNKEAQKMKNKSLENSENDIKINAKATLIRNVMEGKPVDNTVLNSLGDNSSMGNGGKILPSTMTTELLHEPMVKNQLRGHSALTNITNLEIPRITFSLDDDDFIEDGETAKELATSTDTVAFGRHKFKVFASISETVLRGTNTNLVQTVESALESGLAAKEKKVAFAKSPKSGEEHMSFYSTQNAIKKIEGENKYKAIKKCLADLEDMYSDNAEIFMLRTDYYDIIEMLSNGTTSLYAAQPEQVLGAPVTFCDKAVDPVVGDFSFSHFNYDLDMLYDRDKNVKTGMEDFVLTAWFDHQIKLKSAFRIATVTPS